MRHINAFSGAHHSSEFCNFVSLCESSRYVFQSGRKAECTILHGGGDQAFHLCELFGGRRRNAIAHDMLADGVVPDETRYVYFGSVCFQLVERVTQIEK